MGDLPDEGADLSDFVTATPVGKQFIALRETLEKAELDAQSAFQCVDTKRAEIQEK